MNIRPSNRPSASSLAQSTPSNQPWTAPLLASAWTCAAALGSVAAQAGPPDWSKATSPVPATTLSQPVAPTLTPATTGTAAPKAGSAFGAKTTVAPAAVVTANPPSSTATPTTSALAPKATVKAGASAGAVKDLFSVDDRSLVVVSGKQVTGADMKAKLKADIAAKAGAPKLMKATPRKFDLVALNVMSAKSPGSISLTSVSNTKGNATAAITGPNKGLAKGTQLVGKAPGDAYLRAQCADKGPPTIDEVAGPLRAGSRVTIWGACFGDKPGRVEVIGQFAGGKLVPAFTAWDKTSITIEVPATIRGASDHVVAVSVVTSDSKPSAAMQAQFIAAREIVEVPDRMWSVNGGSFEMASTTETVDTRNNSSAVNPAASGRVAKSVRINPQCSLDSMQTTSLAGAVTSINGFDVGPPNEANVTLDWVGTCLDTTSFYHTTYVMVQTGNDYSVSSACRVALQARAWAYCPAGIAP